MQTSSVIGERKSFLSKKYHQLEGFYEPPEYGPLKFTAPNQTLKPLLGVADQDPSCQLPNIPKK